MSLAKSLRKNRTVIVLAVVAASIGGGVAWRVANPAPAAPTRRSAGDRPVPVVTVEAVRKDFPIFLDGLGVIQAYQTVTVHSRVDGELFAVAFAEGQDVKAGDVLARIDPRGYQAQYEQAVATREKDAAQLDEAKVDLARYIGLGNRVTSQSVDTQRATVKQLEATVRMDQAAIDNAKTSLGYTTIASPIDGRTGLRLVDKGNIIHAADTGGLVVVTQLQPISVVFTLPQQNLRAINDEIRTQGKLPVTARDSDSKAPLDRGEVALVDNEIDQTTGTIRLKAVLPNAERHLWPGGFVNIRVKLKTVHDGLVIPASAVQRGPQGTYVYVVKADQTVEMRSVAVATMEGEEALLESGLEASEQVVTDGMGKLQGGSKVVPQPREAQQAAPSSGGDPAGDPAAAPKRKHRKTEGEGIPQ